MSVENESTWSAVADGTETGPLVDDPDKAHWTIGASDRAVLDELAEQQGWEPNQPHEPGLERQQGNMRGPNAPSRTSIFIGRIANWARDKAYERWGHRYEEWDR